MARAFKATETVSTPDGDYTLSIDIAVIDAIEDEFDLDFDGVTQLVAKGRLGKLAKFLRGLLLPRHPDISLDDVFSLAREHGELFNEGMVQLLDKARPDATEGAAGENPPNAHHTTGESSSSRGARPDSRRASSGSKRREPCS